MNDYGILFFCILMICISLYRIIVSILLLCKKKYIIDEKYYISFFYLSLVGIIILFCNKIILGIILVAILPIILTLYVTFSKRRIYWIKNGYLLTESTFINEIVKLNKQYEDSTYRLSKIRFFNKKNEKKIKVEFENVNYEEKEQILNLIQNVCKNNCVKSNKRELTYMLLYILLVLLLTAIIIFVLFT